MTCIKIALIQFPVENNPMEPCVFRMPFPATFKDADELELLANARALFAPPPPNPNDPAYITQLVQRAVSDTLRQYDFVPYDNPQQVRNFVANNLMLAVNDFKTESARLKAMDMLGKMKDVGLFEERSVRTVEMMPTEELRALLADKAKRLRERIIDAETVETPVAAPVAISHQQEEE